MHTADIAIIGGGIVGLATAYKITKTEPDLRVLVLDKEIDIARHQTGRNSGVLHSGIYYKPGSLKAINCRLGKKEMESFCEEENIAYDLCGKVIVAVNEKELPILDRIYHRGLENQVNCEMIDAARLKEIEPYTAGIKAIHVPEAGIVNYTAVSHALKRRIQMHGGEIHTGFHVRHMMRMGKTHVIRSEKDEITASYVINCGGLYADRVARLSGASPDLQIVPFRGEYFTLKPEAERLCRSLIYPVPDPDFPFLGVHFTKMIQGGVECGPNAVLAFAREGYTRTTVNLIELIEILRYSGFQNLARKHWKQGFGELWRSFNKKAFVRALQRLVPDIQEEHLVEAPAGVRAQALRPDGSMVDDFMILASDGVINVCNAPSPAATSSLKIGSTVVEALQGQLEAVS